ncbi:MAG: type VI secretion system baseplate subunit TssG [Burkholderiaceae bacterium]|nr:type VI secretion system baseplate subunit TssG [Burkholderiaceae bacterium]
MAGEIGFQSHRLTWLAELAQRPWENDFYQVLRRVEAWHPHLPRLGEARKPADEPIRMGQEPELTFAPANIWRVSTREDGRVRIGVRFLGLWGPQGPMPLHLTELTRERERHHGDATLARFADLFHHRLLLGFYRTWRQAQPTASRDRPSEDRFRTYVGSTFGQGSPAWFERDSVPDDAKRYFAGLLSRTSRDPDGLRNLIANYFGQNVELETFSPRWMPLPEGQRTALGNTDGSAALGRGAVLGRRVFDVQHHFTLHIGPMSLAAYEQFLPAGRWHARLGDWVLQYVGEEFGVNADLTLAPDQVPALKLGGGIRLGWTSWLGHWKKPVPAHGLQLAVTRVAQ